MKQHLRLFALLLLCRSPLSTLAGGEPPPERIREQSRLDRFTGVFAEQQTPQFCWAACVQMVLNAGGLTATQTDIAAHAFDGDASDRPAPSQTFIATTINSMGAGRVEVTATEHPPLGGFEIVEQLDRGNAVIASLRTGLGTAHAVLIHGYIVDTTGWVHLRIFDPFPGKGHRVDPFVATAGWLNSVVVDYPRVPESRQIDPEAESRLAVELSGTSWNTSGETPTVGYTIDLTNLDRHTALRATVRVHTGTVLRNSKPGDLEGRDWVSHTSKLLDCQLPPGEFKQLTGQMNWFGATESRMPYIDVVVTRCEFVGERKPVAADRLSPADFDTFCGLKRGDSRAQVVAMFGPPERESKRARSVYLNYAANGFTVSIDPENGQVKNVSVSSPQGVRFVTSRTDDPRCDLLGMLAARIKRILGESSGDDAAALEYAMPEVDGHAGSITFGMSEVSGACIDVTVYWD